MHKRTDLLHVCVEMAVDKGEASAVDIQIHRHSTFVSRCTAGSESGSTAKRGRSYGCELYMQHSTNTAGNQHPAQHFLSLDLSLSLPIINSTAWQASALVQPATGLKQQLLVNVDILCLQSLRQIHGQSNAT